MIWKSCIALFVCLSILLPCGNDPKSGEPPDCAQSMEQATLRTPCGWTEEQLEQALRGNLKLYAADFLSAERDYHVNAVFLAAVAALESGWGTSALARDKHNLFGFKSGKTFKPFASDEACIRYVASYLDRHYLTEGGRHFHGYEVKDVCVCYCGTPDWTVQVERIMEQINDRCERRKRYDGLGIEQTQRYQRDDCGCGAISEKLCQ